MRAVADLLERGRLASPVGNALSRVWEWCARPARRLDVPPGVRVVGVAGPTLGGSCVTPTVCALSAALAVRGATVSVAGHGYRAGVRAPRRVAPMDSPELVGDEALWLANALSSYGVSVVVSSTRDSALSAAAAGSDYVVADGLLQSRPRPLHAGLLVLDAEHLFGAERCPPSGDLRASIRRSLEAAGAAVVVARDSASGNLAEDRLGALRGSQRGPPIFRACSAVRGGFLKDGLHIGWERLREGRTGLVLGIARPERVLRTLAEHGVHPVATRFFGDHVSRPRFHSGARFLRRPSVDFWLTTAKCASKLDATYAGAPVVVLSHRVELPASLVDSVLAFEGLRPARPW